jgi:protein-S-isoprenylcysteine O-methyltransferase Ste14
MQKVASFPDYSASAAKHRNGNHDFMSDPVTGAGDSAPAHGSLMSRLREPLFDRSIAVVACAPYIYVVYTQFRAGILHFTTIVLMAHMLLWIGMMSIRRSPVRVTSNPWYWLLAFVATYWPYLVITFTETGAALVPNWLPTGISLFSACLGIYARLSLGRNIGIVPAQRKLVTHGAYGYVRHPIYTALFISLCAAVLQRYSPINLAIAVIGGVLFAVKGIVEERFLAEDAAYRQYMQDVPWRWIPGIA